MAVRPIGTYVTICLFLSVALLHIAKTVGGKEMTFGRDIRSCGLK